MNITPENITDMPLNCIFTFGSNLAGRHGAGAALLARNSFRAKTGVGVGFTGRCYAIPTKDRYLETLPLAIIESYVRDFLVNTRLHPENHFLVTKIGCGLAGYTPAQIAPLFFAHREVPQNVSLPREFWEARA